MKYVLPSGVINTDSAYYYADTTLTLGPLVKAVNDQTLVVADYSLLPSYAVSGFDFALDVTSNPALVVSYPQLNNNVLTFLVSGGIVGQQYNLSVKTIADINNRTDVLTINIPSSSGDCAQVNPVPQIYTQLELGDPTQGYVNTGVRYFWGTQPPVNPNVMDQWYTPDTQTLSEWVTDGTQYFWQIIMSANLVEEAPEDNLIFSRYNGVWVADPVQADVPADGVNYTRVKGSWVSAAVQSDAPINGKQHARVNGAWAVIAPPFTDAPLDGNLYGRNGGVWALAYPVSNPAGYQTAANVAATLTGFMPLSGGTLTGNLTVNANLSISGLSTFTGNAVFNGTVALSNDPISSLQAANKRYVDNAIANFDVNAPFLPLAGGTMTGALVLNADPTSASVAATKRYVDNQVGAATAGGPFLSTLGGTITGNLTVNGTMTVGHAPTAPLQVATKAYVDANSAGGIGDAPLDGFTYGRASNAWSKALAITGGSLTGALVLVGDPTTNLQAATKQYVDGSISAAVSAAPYLPLSGGTLTGPLVLNAAPTTPVQAANKAYVDNKASTTAPLMDGSAAVGSSLYFARDDHVHPTDTTRYAAANPVGYQTAAQVTSAVGAAASTTFPLMDGARATGVGTTWARADHVHPTDTTLVPLVGGTMTGLLTLSGNPVGNLDAAPKQYVDTAAANASIDCGTF